MSARTNVQKMLQDTIEEINGDRKRLHRKVDLHHNRLVSQVRTLQDDTFKHFAKRIYYLYDWK